MHLVMKSNLGPNFIDDIMSKLEMVRRSYPDKYPNDDELFFVGKSQKNKILWIFDALQIYAIYLAIFERNLRRPVDPPLGDDRRHQVEGRGIEGRVVDGDVSRGELFVS